MPMKVACNERKVTLNQALLSYAWAACWSSMCRADLQRKHDVLHRLCHLSRSILQDPLLDAR